MTDQPTQQQQPRRSSQRAPEPVIEQGIKRLDLNTLLPREDRKSWVEDGGGRYTIVGAPGTGKSWILRSLVFSKSHFIPVAVCVSENEDVNKNFGDSVPSLLTFTENSPNIPKQILTRQKIACIQLAAANPLTTVILDDCMNDKKQLRHPDHVRMLKISRQLNVFYLLCCQHNMDLPKELRSSLTGAFLCRETKDENLEVLYRTYGGPIPDLATFKKLMAQITTDHCCLFIKFGGCTDNWLDNVFWYRAFDTRPGKIEAWSACCRDALAFCKERYNAQYNPIDGLTASIIYKPEERKQIAYV